MTRFMLNPSWPLYRPGTLWYDLELEERVWILKELGVHLDILAA